MVWCVFDGEFDGQFSCLKSISNRNLGTALDTFFVKLKKTTFHKNITSRKRESNVSWAQVFWTIPKASQKAINSIWNPGLEEWLWAERGIAFIPMCGIHTG